MTTETKYTFAQLASAFKVQGFKLEIKSSKLAHPGSASDTAYIITDSYGRKQCLT